MASAAKKVEGQLPAFWPDEAEQPREELPYVGPGVEREEIEHRAGTRLDHRWTHRLEGGNHRRPMLLGLLDESQRVFQTGGEFSAFVYWKLNLVTLPWETWEKIRGKVDWIEVIDHEHNECWRMSATKFIKNAVRYNAGIGERVGVSRSLWDVISTDGNVRKGT